MLPSSSIGSACSSPACASTQRAKRQTEVNKRAAEQAATAAYVKHLPGMAPAYLSRQGDSPDSDSRTVCTGRLGHLDSLSGIPSTATATSRLCRAARDASGQSPVSPDRPRFRPASTRRTAAAPGHPRQDFLPAADPVPTPSPHTARRRQHSHPLPWQFAGATGHTPTSGEALP